MYIKKETEDLEDAHNCGERKINMKLKRVLSGIIGFPIVALIFIYANTYIIDTVIGLVAIIAMYEYLKCLSVDYKPVQWIAYVPCLIIPFLHVIPKEYLLTVIGILLTLIVALLFMKVIVSNMKTGISDIAVTLLGICYIVFFLSFIAMLHGTEKGKYLIWYIFISAWGTDTFAYLVGMKFGKHKFSKISPKKSKEGCIRRNNWSNITFTNIYILYKQIWRLINFIFIYSRNNSSIKHIKPNRRLISINTKKNRRNKRLWKLNTRARRNFR